MKRFNENSPKNIILSIESCLYTLFVFIVLITGASCLNWNSNSLSSTLVASVSYEHELENKDKITKRYLNLKAKKSKRAKKFNRQNYNKKQGNNKKGFTAAWILFLLLAVACAVALVAMILIDLFSVGIIGVILLGGILLGIGGFITFLVLANRA